MTVILRCRSEPTSTTMAGLRSGVELFGEFSSVHADGSKIPIDAVKLINLEFAAKGLPLLLGPRLCLTF